MEILIYQCFLSFSQIYRNPSLHIAMIVLTTNLLTLNSCMVIYGTENVI